MQFQIRLATPADLPAINDIYNHYVITSTCTYQEEPSTLAERIQWFEAHDPLHPATVAVDAAGEILGWACLSKFHPRSAYRLTVENALYIRQNRHRQGLGKALLLDLMARAHHLGHKQIIALISAEQTSSIALHTSLGFTHAGRLSQVGYKFNRWLDLLYLQWTVTPPSTPVPDGQPLTS